MNRRGGVRAQGVLVSLFCMAPSIRLSWHSGARAEAILFQEQTELLWLTGVQAGCPGYCDGLTSGCAVTRPGRHSHTTQKEHAAAAAAVSGESAPLWKKPSQEAEWKKEPEAVTGVLWKVGLKGLLPFPFHLLSNPSINPQSLSSLLPSTELKRETKDTQWKWNGPENGWGRAEGLNE